MEKYLNYQGSKTELLDFIYSSLEEYLTDNSVVFDIFSGSCSVSRFFFDKGYTVYANDLEPFSYTIASSFLINDRFVPIDNDAIVDLRKNYAINRQKLESIYADFTKKEKEYIEKSNIELLVDLYDKFPTIWNGGECHDTSEMDFLFTYYYSTSYFGINQAIDIDSLHYSISRLSQKYNHSLLFTLVFKVLNTASFSKDGHMAQPLDKRKNSKRLLKNRRINIADAFFLLLSELETPINNKPNDVFNYDLSVLLSNTSIINKTDAIYA
ncbi:MAG: hypothetical protein E7187_07370, partial [Erysipelotrichaceae bacterium]|nr:hypothetical protein [Erysipelotrichaceae bacterium]